MSGASGSGPRVPLGPFLLDGLIGRGGMGEIWKGVHRTEGYPVAVKVLTSTMSRQPLLLDAFRREVRAVAALSHPCIVEVFAQGVLSQEVETQSQGRLREGSPYLVMELASSGTLSERRGDLPWEELRSVIRRLLDALAHAHARGLIHRDLKPSNVLLSRKRGGGLSPKLSDFGIAHVMVAEDRWAGEADMVLGSPSYMAPEQFEGEWHAYGPWTDLYGLGCLAWTMVTGKPPFTERMIPLLADAHLRKPVPPLEPAMPVPAGLEGWLQRLLAKRPEDRFRFASDAAAALDAVDREGGPTLQLRLPPPGWRRAERAPSLPKLAGAGISLWGLRQVPLVGREAERDAIWQALQETVTERRPRVVLLEGPLGIGKARLAEWMAERAHELGAAGVATASHDPIGGAGHGLVPMLARLLRCQGLAPDLLQDRLRRTLPDQGAANEDELALLTRLLAAPPEAGGGSAAKRAGVAERYAATARALVRHGDGRPLVVILEDAHWGDDSLDFVSFAHSPQAPVDLPLLFVLTAREDVLATRPGSRSRLQHLARLPGARRLTIPPLSPDEHERLVRELLGLERALAAQVARRTEGNPLFAVLLVGDWVQRGVLEQGPRGFRLRRGDRAELPDGIAQVWDRHLDSVLDAQPPAATDALCLAACLGRTVDPGELAAVCANQSFDVPAGLVDRLLERRLAVGDATGWSFAHVMLREALEQRSRRAGQWELSNLACAVALQELHPTAGPRIRGRIGRHLQEAGRPHEALDELINAARQSARLSLHADAESLLDEADAILESEGWADKDPRSGVASVLRAELRYHQDDYARSREAARRAEALAREHDWGDVLAGAIALQGHICRRRGNFPTAERLLSSALVLYVSVADEDGAADCRLGLATIGYRTARFADALEQAELVRAHAEQTGDWALLVGAVTGLAEIARLSGDPKAARRLFEQVIAESRTLGSGWYRGYALNSIGEIDRAEGRVADAMARYTESADAFRAVGSPQSVIPRFNQAYLGLGQGRYREARELLELALAEVQNLGWRTFEGGLHVALATCSAGLARWAFFDEHIRKADARLGDSEAAETDAADQAKLAGTLAFDAGQKARARVAWELGRTLYRRLGDEEAAARMHALLRR